MSTTQKYIVTDLDGTLVNIQARRKHSSYISPKGKEKINFGRFFSPEVILDMDIPRLDVIEMVKQAKREHPDAILVLSSGRSQGTDFQYSPERVAELCGSKFPCYFEDHRTVNYNSIVTYFKVKHDLVFDAVLMREYKDCQDDAQLKIGWLNTVMGGAGNVIKWFDDRPKVVTALTAAGVNVIDVRDPAAGDY